MEYQSSDTIEHKLENVMNRIYMEYQSDRSECTWHLQTAQNKIWIRLLYKYWEWCIGHVFRTTKGSSAMLSRYVIQSIRQIAHRSKAAKVS